MQIKNKTELNTKYVEMDIFAGRPPGVTSPWVARWIFERPIIRRRD